MNNEAITKSEICLAEFYNSFLQDRLTGCVEELIATLNPMKHLEFPLSDPLRNFVNSFLVDSASLPLLWQAPLIKNPVSQ